MINPAIIGSICAAAKLKSVTTALITVADTFDRADANPISNPMSDGIHTWVSGPGAWNDYQIVNNNAVGVSSGYNGAKLADSTTFGADQRATIVVGSVNPQMGVLLRVQNDYTGSCYLVYLSTLTVAQVIKITDTGTLGETQLDANITVNVNVGDTFGGQIMGNTITVLHNGNPQGTRSDSTFSTGNPGIGGWAGSRPINSFIAEEL